MREICTSGSVGAPGRKSTRGYPTNWPTLLGRDMDRPALRLRDGQSYESKLRFHFFTVRPRVL
jgi:hypothetical protein